ncbi:hypothetical protein MMPV_000679 [Pyropia vietnamensis]
MNAATLMASVAARRGRQGGGLAATAATTAAVSAAVTINPAAGTTAFVPTAAGVALRRRVPPACSRLALVRLPRAAAAARSGSSCLRAAAAAAADGGEEPPPPPLLPPPPPAAECDLGPGQVAVRFINTPSGEDVLAVANPGERLLSVGDGVGLSIPRSCVSGLCGSCTCELQDPSWMPDPSDTEGDGGGENGKPGWQTIRACSTEVRLLDGCTEMVVDVVRMRTSSRRGRDPFARFEGLDTGYEAGAAPKMVGAPIEMDCTNCGGFGRHTCYACDGTGLEEEEEEGVSTLPVTAWGQGLPCSVCMGLKVLRCAFCQGKGTRLGR